MNTTKQQKAYQLARADIGTWEWADGHNPKVVKYFAEVGHSQVVDDETAWCAAFVGAMLKRAGLSHTGKLTARSYCDWGEPVAILDAREGDIVIFKRGNSSWQGHVGFFVKDNGQTITVLGGNQNNQVNEKNFSKASLLAIRRARDAQTVILDDDGCKDFNRQLIILGVVGSLLIISAAFFLGTLF